MFIFENVENTENATVVFNTQIKIVSNPTTHPELLLTVVCYFMGFFYALICILTFNAVGIYYVLCISCFPTYVTAGKLSHVVKYPAKIKHSCLSTQPLWLYTHNYIVT